MTIDGAPRGFPLETTSWLSHAEAILIQGDEKLTGSGFLLILVEATILQPAGAACCAF